MNQRDYIASQIEKAKQLRDQIAHTAEPKKRRELQHQLRLIQENIDQQLFKV